MKRWFLWSFVVAMSLVIAACGGSSSGLSSTDSSTSVARTVPGEYTGSYTTNVITDNVPFALSLSQTGSNLTGQFTSTMISGPVTGTVNADKIMNLTVTEPHSLGVISLVVSPSGSGFSLTSVSGTDVFGTHTSGSGVMTVKVAQPMSLMSNGYNGVATFENNTALSSTPITTPSGVYPITITNLLSDGSGNYSGVIGTKFTTGLLGVTYYPDWGIYMGNISNGSHETWMLGYGGFFLNDLETGNLDLLKFDADNVVRLHTSSMSLHPGDFTKVFPGAWSYTNPDQTAVGVLSLNMTVSSPTGVGYKAVTTASVRQVAGGAIDTVSGTITGLYDLNPVINTRAEAGRVFQLGLSTLSPLTITGTSGLTTNFSVYVAWVDNGSGTNKALVSVDTGAKTWPDLTITKAN